MKRSVTLALCAMLIFALSGCAGRVKTYTYQEKRVDQDLSDGNRGVVYGAVPGEEPERKATRTMAGVDIILPDTKAYKERKEQGIQVQEPAVEEYMPEVVEEKPAKPSFMERLMPKKKPPAEDVSYTIQKGDTLQKISQRFFGTTRKWPQIYEANRNVIKDSSHIYPGQTIVIPGSLFEEPGEDMDIK